MDTMDSKFLSEDMINLYPLQKTLCFELIRIDKDGRISKDLEPIIDEKTREHVEKHKIVEHAKKKLEDVKEVQYLLDSIHRDIIEESLENLSKDRNFNDYLKKYINLQKDINAKYKRLNSIKKKKGKKYNEITKDIQDKENQFNQNKNNIFSIVREYFINNDKYEKIFDDKKRGELLKEKFPEKIELISSFDSFNSDFEEYDERLKYIYQDDVTRYDDRFKDIYEENDYKKYTAYKSIPYRLINYNFPIFIKNAEILNDYIRNNRITMYISKDKELELSNISKFPCFFVLIPKDEDFELSDIILKHEAIRNIDEFAHYITGAGIKNYNDFIKEINQEITKYNQRQYENGKRTGKEYSYLSHLGLFKDLFDLEQDTDILTKIYSDKELVDIIKTFSSEDNLKEFKDVFINIDQKYNLEQLYIKNGDYLNKLGLNTKKINKSYIQLSELKSELKSQNVCETISNKAIELVKNFDNALRDENLKEILAKFDGFDELDELKKFEILSVRDLGRHKDKKKNKEEINCIENFLDSIKKISEFVSLFMPKKSEDRHLINFDKINFDIYNKINPERLAKIDQIYNHVQSYFTQKKYSTKKIRLNFDVDSFLETWDIDKIDSDLKNILIKEEESYLGTILIKKENGIKKYFLGIINKENFSGFEYVEEAENNYEPMICKKEEDVTNSTSDNNKKEKAYISRECIKNMVERDELYLFQISNKHLRKDYYKNKNFHTIYWNNVFDDYNKKNKIFTINGEAKLFYRPKSLEREITHPKGQDIPNKTNPKEISNFNIDLIKDKRYTENKLLLYIPVTININSQLKDIFEFQDYLKKQPINQNTLNKKILKFQEFLKNQPINQGTLNKKILELQDYLKKQSQNDLNRKILELQDYLKKQPQNDLNRKILEKIRKSEDINIIGISRSRDDLLSATVIDLNGKEVNKESISLSKIVSNGYSKKKGEYEQFWKDYNVLVNDKEQEKNEAKDKDDNITVWKAERSIKDFLTGYTSQVVNQIVNLINQDKKNSIVVFEEAKSKNLKDSKIEESLYRDLIKALISKLSYLSYKDKNSNDLGSTFNGFQLAYYEKEDEKEYNKLEKFKKDKAKNKNGKNEKKLHNENIIQNGIVFHNVPTKWASDIDTDTGFVNFFELEDNISIKDFKEFIQKFDITLCLEKEIYRYIKDKEKDKEYLSYAEEKVKVKSCYAFEFKYEDFRIKKKNIKDEEIEIYKFLCGDIVKNIKKVFLGRAWTLYSCVDRIEERDGKFVDGMLNKKFRDLFKYYIPNTINKEIGNEIIEEFSNYIHSYEDFDIDDDNTDINKREFLINLRNSSDSKDKDKNFEEEFDDIFERDVFEGAIDKNSKILGFLKRKGILKGNILDKIEKANEKQLEIDKDILYNIVKHALDILKKYEKDFVEIHKLQNDIVDFLDTARKDKSKEFKAKEFCKEFIRLFKLMLQMRNYDVDNNYEYVLSPVGIPKGGALKFFHSSLDENSSKHIAKKGLILVNRIRKPKVDLDKLELKVTDEEWIKYVTDNIKF